MNCNDKQKFKTSEASSKASMRTKGAIDKFLNILDFKLFNNLNNKWTDDAKKRFGIKGKLFYEESGKAIPNKIAFKQIDNSKGIFYQKSKQKNQNEIEYSLKAINILQSDKAKQVFDKGTKAKWDLNKILTELQIPKEQKQLILDLGFKVLTNNDARLFKNGKWEDIQDLRKQLALELANKYSYSVEINTAKSPIPNYKGEDIENTTMSFEYKGYKYITDGGMYIKKSLTNEDDFDSVSKKEFNELREKYIKDNQQQNTNYYSNLTVPGGTNGSYREQNFETPLIKVPKSHAQFNTENTIGFTRGDDRQVYTEKDINSLLKIMQKSGILEINCG